MTQINNLIPAKYRLRYHSAKVRLRHFYPYLWAHAPLCKPYRREILRLGPFFICRSCFLCFSGFLIGLGGILIILTDVMEGYKIPWWILIVAFILALVLTRFHTMWVTSRFARDVSRFLLGSCGSILIMAPPIIGWWGFLFWPAFYPIISIVRTRKNIKAEDKCKNCPDRSSERACPGFSRQVQATKAINLEL